jgi:hypothetical protein
MALVYRLGLWIPNSKICAISLSAWQCKQLEISWVNYSRWRVNFNFYPPVWQLLQTIKLQGKN